MIFHIISKDTGFDPLIEHLKSRSVRAYRHSDYTSLTFKAGSQPTPKVTDDLKARVITRLRKHPNNRPKRKKTLVSHLTDAFLKSSNGTGVEELIKDLIKDGQLQISDKGAVTYSLD